MLAKYDEVVEGAANRILSMAERQQQHRLNIEAHVIKVEGRRTYMGLLGGVIVTLASLAVAGVLVAAGHGGLGTLAALSPIAALAGVFVYGTRSRRHDAREG